MDQVALGKRIKAAREAANMTQEELAEVVDYSASHMSVVERGVKAPKLEKLVLIANTLGVGLDELLQDQLNVGSRVRSSELSDRIAALPPEKQRRVLAILDTVIEQI